MAILKGNAVVGQSGGPTAVINSSLAGAIRAAKDHGVKKVYGMHHGIEGFLNDDVIDMDIYFDDLYELSLLKRTPSAFLGSCRYKLPEIEGNEDIYEKMFLLMEKYDIEYFLYIGGNDSMDTIKQLSDYAAMHGKHQKFIGIPKTIDNDLPVTDHTPGYGSASKFIATTMKEIIRDNESFGASEPKLCVVEIMGRNAGWLTAAAALAGDTFLQLNAWTPAAEYNIMLSRKGQMTVRKSARSVPADETHGAGHDRKKQYLLPEGTVVPPLVDLGVLTADGRIVKAKYDKFKQINRFLEFLDDLLAKDSRDTVRIIDFGCGKSYLTFILYYYLTEVRGLTPTVIGLDLKADVS